MRTPKDYFKAYVDGVGGRAVAAERLGVTVAMVGHLLTGARDFSPKMSIAVERDSGGDYPRELFRPDLFGREAA